MDDIKKPQNNFLYLNIQLLQILRKALEHAEKKFNTDQVEPWQRVSIWRDDVLPYLETLIRNYNNDILTLAKFQIGLAKYLYFFYLGWAGNKRKNIENKVEEIVIQAYLIVEAQSPLTFPMSPFAQCIPPHEDGACKMMPLGKRCNTQKPLPDPSGGDDLPIIAAKSFLPDPYPVTLEPETLIYRIIGNNPCGCWWFTTFLS